MFGDRFSSSTTCSRWRHETEPGQLDQSLSCRFWKVATHPFAVVVLGGLIQVVLGVLRLGRFVVYTPYVVISGFMSGVGVIIMLLQVLPFLGRPPVGGGPVAVLRALPDALANMNPSAVRPAPLEASVRVPSSGPGGARVLPLHVHHRRRPSRPEPSWAGERGRPRL